MLAQPPQRWALQRASGHNQLRLLRWRLDRLTALPRQAVAPPTLLQRRLQSSQARWRRHPCPHHHPLAIAVGDVRLLMRLTIPRRRAHSRRRSVPCGQAQRRGKRMPPPQRRPRKCGHLRPRPRLRRRWCARNLIARARSGLRPSRPPVLRASLHLSRLLRARLCPCRCFRAFPSVVSPLAARRCAARHPAVRVGAPTGTASAGRAGGGSDSARSLPSLSVDVPSFRLRKDDAV